MQLDREAGGTTDDCAAAPAQAAAAQHAAWPQYIVGISLIVWVIFGISNVNVQLCFGRFVCSNASRVPPG